MGNQPIPETEDIESEEDYDDILEAYEREEDLQNDNLGETSEDAEMVAGVIVPETPSDRVSKLSLASIVDECALLLEEFGCNTSVVLEDDEVVIEETQPPGAHGSAAALSSHIYTHFDLST